MSNFKLPPYKVWERRYLDYKERGMDLLVAWHKANKDFDMGGKERKEFEEKYQIDLDSQ